ncbi:MAG: hypothetical protein KBC96_12130 [Armatimonadetes bacterium]|nr:hypothetical protein [Armatimonadota bacterium]
MKILVSCVGNSDPYGDGKSMPGPILTLVEELDFDEIFLLHVAGLNKRASETARLIPSFAKNNPEVEHRPMLLDDPTDYPRVLRAMRAECVQIVAKHSRRDAEYSVQISSGTPQMQWAWVVLVHRRIIPATAIALHPRYMRQFSAPYHYAVDLNDLGIDHLAQEGELQESVEALSAELTTLKLENARLRASVEKTQSSIEEEVPDGFRLFDYLQNEKKRLIAQALQKHPDNAAEAARMLGMEAPTLRRAAEDLGLRPRQRK